MFTDLINTYDFLLLMVCLGFMIIGFVLIIEPVRIKRKLKEEMSKKHTI